MLPPQQAAQLYLVPERRKTRRVRGVEQYYQASKKASMVNQRKQQNKGEGEPITPPNPRLSKTSRKVHEILQSLVTPCNPIPHLQVRHQPLPARCSISVIKNHPCLPHQTSSHHLQIAFPFYSISVSSAISATPSTASPWTAFMPSYVTRRHPHASLLSLIHSMVGK